MVNSGHIRINKNDRKSAIGSLDIAAKKMKQEGKSVGIAPEGTRRLRKSIPSGEHLLPFKKGPFHMAKQAECDIVLISYQGVDRLRSGIFYRPGTIKVKIGSRIPKGVVNKLSVDELMEKARRDMVEQLQPFYPDTEVFKVTRSRISWVIFILAQLCIFFLL